MSNDWIAFAGLSSKTGTKLVTVISHVGSESVVQDLNALQFRVPGTDYAVGARVYVRDGEIISQATDLVPGGTFYV
jgi:hypothetical protein